MRCLLTKRSLYILTANTRDVSNLQVFRCITPLHFSVDVGYCFAASCAEAGERAYEFGFTTACWILQRLASRPMDVMPDTSVSMRYRYIRNNNYVLVGQCSAIIDLRGYESRLRGASSLQAYQSHGSPLKPPVYLTPAHFIPASPSSFTVIFSSLPAASQPDPADSRSAYTWDRLSAILQCTRCPSVSMLMVMRVGGWAGQLKASV